MAKRTKDPAIALLRAGHTLRYGDGSKGLEDLFFTAAQGDAPKEWRRALRAKTKQLRRSHSYQGKAVQAADAGKKDEAHRRLDQAEEILNGTEGQLGVEFLGPSLVGFLDLWKWVMRGERDRFHTAVRKVLNSPGSGVTFHGISPPPR